MQPDLSQFDLGAVDDDKPEATGGGQFDLAAADAQVQAEARMRDNLRRALKENPDEFAAALDLSNRTTLPFDVVKRNQPDVANYVEAQKPDLLKLRIENPALFDWLDKTPENLTVARDDIGNLSGIEWFNKAVPGAFGEGMQQTELAQLRLLEKRGQATPDQIARADFLSEQGQNTYAAEGFWQKGLVEGVRQLPNMLYAGQAGMKQGLATAGGFAGTALLAGQAGPQVATPEELVTVPSAAVAGMAIGTAAGAAKFSRDVETGLAFDEFKKFRDVDGKPIDPAVASLAADVAGTLNAGLETFGLSKILETIPGIKAVAGRGGIEAVKLALKQPTVLAAFKGAAAKYGTAVGAEVGTEVLQELSTITAGELGKLASGQQFAPTDGGAIASRLEKTLEMAFYGTALLAAPGPAAGLVMDASRAKQSKITQQRLEALGESAKASKLRERLPEKYREVVDSIREKHGTVESVHIDAQQAGQLFQAAGLDGADFFREVMGDAGAEKWAEAVATGGRIEVPFADYATKIAASDWHGPLIKHSTLSAEGMTPFEAEQYDREVEGELERFRDVDGRTADPANAVFDDTVGQLIGTGQSRKDAETNAIYRVGLYRAFGQRFGMSPEEFMARFPTTINGPGSPVLQARKEFNDLDPYIDAIRANKLPTDEDIYGGRLITAIIANGGIDPQSAGADDLNAMDAGKQRVGLFRKGGRTVEEMAMTLSEGGFAELFNTRDEAGQPDYRELLDLVRDDLMGEVRNPNVKNQKLFDFRETSRSLATALDEAGIDVRGLSNKEVVEKLRAAMEGNAQPEGQALDQDFGQAGDATFDEAGARPEVVQWARAKWGDQIAPNGRPVWQNFVAWFGDSKVVDDSGKPLVVYHSTYKPFDVFDVSRRSDGFGFYFATSERKARRAAKQIGAIIPAYISASRVYGTQQKPLVDWTQMRFDAEGKRLAEAGYDAVWVRDEGGSSLVVRNPNQIKSAVGNSGNFAGDRAGILEQAIADYRGEHTAPMSDSGAPASDLSAIYPDDLYGPRGAEYYGHYGQGHPMDRASVGIIASLKGKPNASVTIYRAVPKIKTNAEKIAELEAQKARMLKTGKPPADNGFSDKSKWYDWASREIDRLKALPEIEAEKMVINPGDWVTINRAYAKEHGEGALNGEYRIISKTVKAKQIFTNGDSIHEWGYDPAGTGKAGELNQAAYNGNPHTILDQRRPRTEEPKGSVYGAMPGQRLPDGSRAFRVNLLRKADLTTFVHETGHMAYAMMADLADDFLRIPEAERTADQARLIEDYQKLTEWTGAASFDTMTEKQLEKVARGFEAYVMEGKAPSEELRSAFSRVRSFMVAIYRTLKGLVKQAGQEIDLNDEVRAVFDRMLATEDQIAETRAANNMEAMFKAPSDLTNLNASGAEIAAYMRAVADDEQKATDAVAAKVMETIRRRRQADFEDLRATVRAEVAAEMAEVPVYRAMSVLADGKLPDGSPLPEALQGLVRGLDKGWLMEEFGQAWLNENLRRKRVYRLEGGMNPDLAAEVLGFTSGRALVTAMAEAAPRREYLEAETERRLNEIIPDPIRDGSISDEAMAAIHNERRGEVLTIELKLLERRAQAGGKPTTRQVARRIAERVVSERRYRDLSPNRYRVAERKAAREAIKAAAEGNYAKAAEAKRQELLNFYLWKVSNEAQEKAERARDYLDRAAKQSARERLAKAGPDFVEQADTILSAYGFRPASAAPSTLREWVRTKEEAGYETNIGDLVLRRTESGRATTWRDLSMDELTEVYESVKSIAHLAKMEREWLQNDQKVDADIAKFLLTDRLKKSLAAKKLPFTDAEASTVESATKAVGEFAAQLLHPQTLIEWFDGGETGPWHDFFWNQAEKAQDMRDQLRERVMKPLMDLVNGWDSKQRERMNRPIEIRSMGGVKIARSTLISMALNMGNAGNLDRLMRGGYWHNGKDHQISDQAVREIKGYLSAEDWQLVQFMWDRVDTLWPDVVAFQKEMGGLVPERVEAVPVETEHGTFRGGYWPVVYDPDQSSMGAKQEAGKALSDAMGGITKATTKKSFLKARTQAARPLLLNFQRILSRHVDEVITDLSHRRFVLQANRILDDGELSNLIRERVGPLAFKSLRGMVGHTIADRRYYDPGTAPLDTMTDWFITNTAVAALGFKIATAIGNLVVAPIQAAARVNPKEMVLALRTYATDYKNTVALVHTLSPYMKHRAENMDASFGDVMQRLRGQNTRKAQLARLAMSIHQFADRQATTVIWLARFNQTKRKHGIDGAVRLANKAIQQTQTAGAPKDLSAFQRSPQHKLAKLFLGPMIIMGNRIRDAGHRRGAVHNLPEAFGTLLATWFIPSIMFELAVGRGPDGEEPEDWVKWALVKFGIYPFMTIPYLREGAAVADAALLDKPVFSRGHPVSEAIQGGVKAALAVTDAAIDAYEGQPVNAERLTKTVVRGIGPLIGVPTGQLTTTGEYIYDVLSGREDIKSPLDMKYLIYRRDADSQK